MSRKITGGLVGSSTLVGTIQISPDSALSTAADTNITLSPGGTGNIVATANIQLNAQNDLRFADGDSSNYVAVQAPATVATNYTITLPNVTPTAAGLVLAASDTAGTLTWQTPKSFTYSTVATNFSAVNFGGYFVNTTSGGVTATLPASPAVGDTIRFLDAAKTFDTNTFTVARNGKLMQGDAADLTVTTESAAFELIFSGDTFGWRIFSV
jgi:hypothetical protein